jgi:hypothetical protein
MNGSDHLPPQPYPGRVVAEVDELVTVVLALLSVGDVAPVLGRRRR